MDYNCKFIKGTCELMCPEKETRLRTKEKIIHYFEEHPPATGSNRSKLLLIKEFARSAAGIKTPLPNELRTPNALKATIAYLIEFILLDKRRKYWFVYNFIFDRLRCIRQEIVIQNLDKPTTILLLEQIIMFLAYSSYKLCEEPIDNYDPHVCNQHLQECLKKLLFCYDEADKEDQFETYSNTHRRFFESLYLILNLGHIEATQRAVLLMSNKTVFHTLIKNSLCMSLNYSAGYYYKVIRDMNKLPHLLCALATLKLQTIRRTMLLRFSVAYQSKQFTVPVAWLCKILLYKTEAECLRDCKYYNCEISDDRNAIKFSKCNFRENIEVIKPRHEDFADVLLNDDVIREIILLKYF